MSRSIADLPLAVAALLGRYVDSIAPRNERFGPLDELLTLRTGDLFHGQELPGNGAQDVIRLQAAEPTGTIAHSTIPLAA